VLVLEPGGGLDVAVAQSRGVERIVAVSPNPLVIDAVRQYGAGLYERGQVEVIARSPRSYASEQPSRFDIVEVALTDAQRTVVSGAYTLGEDYRYTVEAVVDYLALLEPSGILVLHRWLQTPPSESVRAWALAIEAIERMGWSAPRDSLVAIRSWSTMLILAKKGPFAASELETVREFCETRKFDLVFLPGMRADEANRHNVYQGAPYATIYRRLLNGEERDAILSEYEYDVRPLTDDRPFFFHFFRWRQVPEIWQRLGHTWQPFGGGGYLVLVALLGVATLASVGLIVLPLVVVRGPLTEMPARSRARVLAYFGCLGVAYLAIEIPLIQRFVLFLDQPTTAFATVLCVLLLASGVGSLLAPRIGARRAIPALVLYLLLLVIVLPSVFDWFLGYPLAIRVVVACLLLAPLGMLMGIPFPSGLALIQGRVPGLVPWAWGVNGCTSVIASVLTALVALSWGFTVVFVIAAATYACAWVLLLTGGRHLSAALAYGDRSE
jgi:hypothetical protein